MSKVDFMASGQSSTCEGSSLIASQLGQSAADLECIVVEQHVLLLGSWHTGCNPHVASRKASALQTELR